VSQPEANRAMRRLGTQRLVVAITRRVGAAAAQGERAEYRIDNLSLFCKRGSATECARENVAQQRNDRHPRPVRSTLAELPHVADAMGSRNRRQTEHSADANEPKGSVCSATPDAPSLIAVARFWGMRRTPMSAIRRRRCARRSGCATRFVNRSGHKVIFTWCWRICPLRHAAFKVP
jgi:hypothetical protein